MGLGKHRREGLYLELINTKLHYKHRFPCKPRQKEPEEAENITFLVWDVISIRPTLNSFGPWAHEMGEFSWPVLLGVTSDLLRGENVFWIICCVSATLGAAVTLVVESDTIRTKSLDPNKRGLL